MTAAVLLASPIRTAAAAPIDRDRALAGAQSAIRDADLSRARELYTELLAAHPEDDEARAGLARLDAWDGSLAQAESAYRAILARHPNDAEVRAGLADVLSWQGRWDDLEHELEAGLASSPDAPPLLERKARWLHLRGDELPAADAIARAERGDPSLEPTVGDAIAPTDAQLLAKNDFYPDDGDDLRILALSAAHAFGRLRLGVRTEQSQRFASTTVNKGYNALYAVNAGYPLAIGWRATVEGGFGAPARSIPAGLLGAHLDFPLPGRLAGGAGYAFWAYGDASTVQIIDPVLGFEVNDRLRLEAHYWLALVHPSGLDSTSAAHTFGARAIYQIATRLELSGQFIHGQALDRQPSARDLLALESNIGVLGANWRIDRLFGLAPSYRFERRTGGNTVSIHSLEGAAYFRW